MKSNSILLFLLSARAFATPIPTPLPSAQPLLHWQNQEGRQISASFEKVEGRTLFLRLANGAEVRVPLDDLEDGSKLQAMDLARKSKARAAAAAHDLETYRLRMYPKAVPFTLDILEDGKGIDYGPFMSEVLLVEQTPAGEKIHRSRGMNTPLREQDEQTHWRGQMQNNMQVDIRIKRAETSLTLDWSLLSAETPPATLEARVSLVFPPLEGRSAPGDLRILAVAADGQTRPLNTSSPSDAFQGEFRSLDIFLPGTKTVLSFRVPENSNSTLGLHVEPTKSLSDGFRLDTRLKNPQSKRPATLLIDCNVRE